MCHDFEVYTQFAIALGLRMKMFAANRVLCCNPAFAFGLALGSVPRTLTRFLKLIGS